MSSKREVFDQTSRLPIRPGLFIEHPDPSKGASLIGCRCRECGNTFFPKEEICPVCIKEGTLDEILLDGKGKLVSFTRVLRPIPGFDSPYALGCIELEAGPVLIAQLEDWQGLDLEMDMPVELVIGEIKRDKDGNTIIGPKFRPLTN